MRHIQYQTQGTCSQVIDVTVDDNDVIQQVFFLGGCNGNLKAVGKLCEGMTADEIAGKLLGNTCGFRDTSCADQLSKAVLEAKSKL